jgi:threonine dehydratase
MMTSSILNDLLGMRLWFKCENLQKAGAFKSRGAVHAVFSLPDEQLQQGVCTHSSGNHAQALARAAALRGIPSRIVMPDNAPSVKVEAVKSYGGEIVFCRPTLFDRESTLRAVKERTGATEVHPYNEPSVILGQATCAREIYEDFSGTPDFLFVPVGGGGLLSGSILSTLAWSPSTKVLGAEPAGANDAWQSLKSGRLIPSQNPVTVADGLLTSLGSNTWPIIKTYVADIVLASESFIVHAMQLIWQYLKLVIEPSAALPLAVLLQMQANGGLSPYQEKQAVLILSGGNVDLKCLPW